MASSTAPRSNSGEGPSPASNRLVRCFRTARLGGILAGAALRSEVQYRANFLMMSVGLLYQTIGFAFVWVLLSKFQELGGWTIAEIAFLYGIRLCAHGLWVVPFHRMLSLDRIVQRGEIDRYLVRPLNPLVQLLTSKFWLGSFGDIVGGIVILSVATRLVDVSWDIWHICYLIVAIVGGALIECSFNLALASLTFRMLSAGAFVVIADRLFSVFGNYPLVIFDHSVQLVFTYVVPLAFVAYFPASVMLGRTDELQVTATVALLAPALGVIAFILAYQCWRSQMRHYSSAGS